MCCLPCTGKDIYEKPFTIFFSALIIFTIFGFGIQQVVDLDPDDGKAQNGAILLLGFGIVLVLILVELLRRCYYWYKSEREKPEYGTTPTTPDPTPHRRLRFSWTSELMCVYQFPTRPGEREDSPCNLCGIRLPLSTFCLLVNEVIKLITPKTGKGKAKGQKLPKRGIRITMYRLGIH